MSKKVFDPDVIIGRDLALIGKNGCIEETYNIVELVPAESKDGEYTYLVRSTDDADMFSFTDKEVNNLLRGKCVRYSETSEFLLIG